MKGTITLTVDSSASRDALMVIRERYKDYKVNIIISGKDCAKESIKNFIKAGLKT